MIERLKESIKVVLEIVIFAFSIPVYVILGLFLIIAVLSIPLPYVIETSLMPIYWIAWLITGRRYWYSISNRYNYYIHTLPDRIFKY